MYIHQRVGLLLLLEDGGRCVIDLKEGGQYEDHGRGSFRRAYIFLLSARSIAVGNIYVSK